MKKWQLIIVLILSCLTATGQTGLVKRALKQISDDEFLKALVTLEKVEEKDSLYSGLYFAKSRLHFDPSYEKFDIDSAHVFLLQAQHLLDSLEEKDQTRLSKIGAGFSDIEILMNSIDSAAFKRAKTINTEDSYLFFLANYPQTSYQLEVVELRNTRAFEGALKVNTYQAYLNFMNKYPEAKQFNEAEKRYERLYFEKSTADGKLASFKKFLVDHPTTPYRNELEQRIYNVMTADNSLDAYKRFRKQYPSSPYAKLAEKFGYHIAKGNNKPFEALYFKDSLSTIDGLSDQMLIYFQNNKYGLMDLRGNTVSEAKFENVQSQCLCEGIQGDVFLANNTLYGVNGVPVVSGVEAFRELGAGLLAIEQGEGLRVIHKSGMLISKGLFEDVRLLNEQFLAYKTNEKWALRTVSDIKLSKSEFDDIIEVGAYILFKKNDQYDIKIPEQLVKAADNNSIKYHYLFDDYELLENGAIWLHSAYGEVIFDEKSNELIPYQKQEINFLPFGYSVKQDGSYQLFNDSFQTVDNRQFTALTYNDNYIIAELDSAYRLIRTDNYVELDSYGYVELFGNQFAIAYKEDTAIVFARNASQVIIPAAGSFKLISSTGSKEFLLHKKGNKLNIIHESASLNNVKAFSNFSALDDFLIVERKGRKGIVLDNDVIVPVEHDAIGRQEEGVTLLKRGKFGLYVQELNLLINARYDERIKEYGNSLFVASNSGDLVFIDKKGNELSRIEDGQDINYWQDSIALVKVDNDWKFYEIYENGWSGKSIKSFSYLPTESEELLIIALGNEGYGVLSNARGEIIPTTFNDVVQIGPTDNPVYFTEKHISEAEFYVVIYYDTNGNVIRKQAFEASEYDLVYCNR